MFYQASSLLSISRTWSCFFFLIFQVAFLFLTVLAPFLFPTDHAACFFLTVHAVSSYSASASDSRRLAKNGVILYTRGVSSLQPPSILS